MKYNILMKTNHNIISPQNILVINNIIYTKYIITHTINNY